MTAHVRRPRGTSVEINRVAKISARDLIDTEPDVLCELKRAVDTMDALEVSDNAQWVSRVAALPSKYQQMFARGQYDRLRYRHYVYGFDRLAQQDALGAVLSASTLVATWYRLQASTPNAGKWDNVVDVLGGSPMTQVVAGRRPSQATSANGFSVASFNGANMWLMPLAAAGTGNNGTSKWWCRFRVKPIDFAATQTILGWTSAAGTAPNKLTLTMLAGGSMMFTAFASGFDGRNYSTAAGILTAGSWNTVYVQFDNTRTNEFDNTGALVDSRMRIFVGNTFVALTGADTGAGGAVTALLSSAGTGVIGAANNADVPAAPLRSGTLMDSNLQFGVVPLSDAQLTAFNNFEAPT